MAPHLRLLPLRMRCAASVRRRRARRGSPQAHLQEKGDACGGRPQRASRGPNRLAKGAQQKQQSSPRRPGARSWAGTGLEAWKGMVIGSASAHKSRVYLILYSYLGDLIICLHIVCIGIFYKFIKIYNKFDDPERRVNKSRRNIKDVS